MNVTAWRRRGALFVVLLAAASAAGIAIGNARSTGDVRRGEHALAGKPIMAIVSLSDQRISIYDANGRILQSPVSSGAAGYETPAGIFSIVQKKEMHSSNLYEDGEMPFMQRITWTGIALHAGVLPGHPASHGCIRLPTAFAQQLFSLTELGMRVVLVRDDMAPTEIAHPALFRSQPVAKELVRAAPVRGRSVASNTARRDAPAPEVEVTPGSPRHMQILQSLATAKAAESEEAAARERDAKRVLAKTTVEAAGAIKSLRAAEANLAKAEAALKDAERRLESSTSSAASPRVVQQAEAAKAKAADRVGKLQAQLEDARAQVQTKQDAADRASEDAKSAAAAREGAAREADMAAQKTQPVSVFVSRKTQRLYVRKSNYPIYEGPVTIEDAQTPIGTFVFTALGAVGTSGDMRWSVVSMYPDPTRVEPAPSRSSRREAAHKSAATPTDAAAAKRALDRLTFPKEALDVISDVVLAGSSLIISDEGPSRETGKDTDFVVVMSGEPQGALKIRHREPLARDRDDDYYPRSRWRGGFPFLWD